MSIFLYIIWDVKSIIIIIIIITIIIIIIIITIEENLLIRNVN